MTAPKRGAKLRGEELESVAIATAAEAGLDDLLGKTAILAVTGTHKHAHESALVAMGGGSPT